MTTEQVGRGLVRAWRDWIRPVLVVVVLVTSFRSAVADWNDVPTGSMQPTIVEGDRIVVNKLAYDLKVPYTRMRLASWDDPERGDIVVLVSPSDGVRLVKRVIGLPGDRIAITGHLLEVNGERIPCSPAEPPCLAPCGATSEPGGRVAVERLGDEDHQVLLSPRPSRQQSLEHFTVPDDHFFVLGDNRDNSLDSRAFGTVPRDLILGRALAVAASVDRDHRFRPRWGRFFLPLR